MSEPHRQESSNANFENSSIVTENKKTDKNGDSTPSKPEQSSKKVNIVEIPMPTPSKTFPSLHQRNKSLGANIPIPNSLLIKINKKNIISRHQSSTRSPTLLDKEGTGDECKAADEAQANLPNTPKTPKTRHKRAGSLLFWKKKKYEEAEANIEDPPDFPPLPSTPETPSDASRFLFNRNVYRPRSFLNIEKMTSEERISRMLHTKKTKAEISSDTKFFEHFLVVGVKPERCSHFLPQFEEEARARRKSKKKIETVPSLTPEIIHTYPYNVPLTIPGVANFCFPEGIRPVFPQQKRRFSTPSKKEQDQAHVSSDELPFVFLMTDINGGLRYGICVFLNHSFSHDNQTVHFPLCFCLISKLPFFPLHVNVLQSICEIPYVHELPFEYPFLTLIEIENEITEGLTAGFTHLHVAEGKVPQTERCKRVSRRLSKRYIQLPVASPQIPMEPSTSPWDAAGRSIARTFGFEEESGTPQVPNGSILPHIEEDDNFTPTEELMSILDTRQREQFANYRKMNIKKAFKTLISYQETAVPKEGERLDFFVMNRPRPLTFFRPDYDDEEEMLAEWGLPLHLQFLSIEHTLFLFSAILLERKVALICSNPRILSSIVLSFLPLIRPFSYQSPVIPILPTHMHSFLHAPVPLLAGVLQLPEDADTLNDVIFFDITNPPSHPYIHTNQDGDDKYNVLYHTSKEGLPSLPKLDSIMPTMEKLYNQFFFATNLEKYSKSNKNFKDKHSPLICYLPTLEQLAFVKVFSGMYESYFSQFFNDFSANCISDLTSSETISIFLKDSFLENQAPVDRPFFQAFFQTGIWSVYSDDQLIKLDQRKTDYHGRLNPDLYKTM